MRKLVILIILVLTWLVSRSGFYFGSTPDILDASALAALGFIVLGGHIIGQWLKKFGLPQVTGYMLTGIFAGPYLAGILTNDMIPRLTLFNEVALVLIAITAGGELRIDILRKFRKAILGVLFAQSIVIIPLALLLFFLLSDFILPQADFSSKQMVAVGGVLAVMMIANSPSVAVAVINELRSSGKNTDLVMAVTVAKDALVMVLFTFVMTFLYELFKQPQQTVHNSELSLPIRFLVSMAAGGLAGVILAAYLKYIRRQVEVAILVVSIVMIHLVFTLRLELLLTAISAGFIVENLSSQGPVLMKGLKKVSQPIYVIFFVLSGAVINLPLLVNIGVIALTWASMRAVGLWFGTLLGLRYSGFKSKHGSLVWLGYIPQAGVTMGMAMLVASTFPEWGETIRTLVLSVVAINQVFGPVGMRYMLVKSGEAGKQK